MGKLQGRTALVTGASSGIGAEIARNLAHRGCNLVLSARRKERLDALAEELRAACDIETTVITADLATPNGARELHAACEGNDISICVNNAGFGDFHHFGSDADHHERSMAMVQLNVTSLTELCDRFIADFRGRTEQCYVLNVGSMVAWMPIPNLALYCGTKSFVRNFSESLAAELKGTNVSVTCLSPGGTRTEFVDVAGQTLPSVAEKSLMSPERCAKVGVSAMLRGKRNVVPGFSNKFVCFLTRFLPRRAFGSVARKMMGEVDSRRLDSTAAAE